MKTKKALLISCFDWYKKRIEPVRDILISKGYSVTVLTAEFDHFTKKTVQIRYPECTYIPVPQYKSNLSLQRIYSHLCFGKSVGNRINKIKPYLVYLQIPPNNAAKYCTIYKRKYPDIKLLLDIVDLWPESIPIGVFKNIKIWKRWRNDCADSADHIFTECDLYREKLNLNSEKTSTLYLFKKQSEEEKKFVEEIIKNHGVTPNKVKFAYLGAMNSIIDIDGICEVIKMFINNGYDCELHSIGDGESREKFEAKVKETGCKPYFYGVTFDEIEKIKILAPCDYAFNMMKTASTVGLTIKSIDYLSYGLPLINNIRGDTWRMVENEKIGFNVESIKPEKGLIRHMKVVEIYKKFFTKEAFIKSIENLEILS